MSKHILVFILVTSLFFSLSIAKPVLADKPSVLNVIPWNSGGNTMLNVTVYHNGETDGHYVNNITVSIGGDIQYFSQSSLHTFYDPINHYFNVTVGPIIGITGTPTATVGAICSIHGPSDVNWAGPIPEFTLPVLLIALTLCTSIAVFILRKAKTRIHS